MKSHGVAHFFLSLPRGADTLRFKDLHLTAGCSKPRGLKNCLKLWILLRAQNSV
jgi:hypothetical protein